MSNISILKTTGELKAASNSMLDKIGESRRKAHDAMMNLRELEDSVKVRIREDHERARAEEAMEVSIPDAPAAGAVAPAAEKPMAQAPAAAQPRAEQSKAEAAPAAEPKPAEKPQPAEAAAQKPAPEPVKAEPAAQAAPEQPAPEAKKPETEQPKAAQPKAEAPAERVFTPRPDDRPRPSYGRDDNRQGNFQPRPQQGTFTPRPRPESNAPIGGTFTPRPRPESNAPIGGTFTPRPRPESNAPIGGTFTPRPRPESNAPIGGTFVPRPRPESSAPIGGTFVPRPRPESSAPIGGKFIPRPRPEGGAPIGGTFTPRPRPEGGTFTPRPGGPGGAGGQRGGYRPGGGGGYNSQRPVTERDIKKQLNVTPTQQKERVSNYDPNKTDLRRREKVAESLAEDKKNKNKRLTDFNPNADDEVSFGRRKKLKKQTRPERIVISEAVITGDRVTIKTLAEKIGKPGAEIIKKLMLLGTIATINQDIDYETAALIASEFGITLNQELAKTFEERMVDFYGEEDEQQASETRPPIVTIMGHVDHGKTSLLDAIRKTKVAAGEAGGITQHIGAYSVDIHDRKITFLDTPGHEAFTSMRARGAQATDIAILVIAATEGVMPQTVEAINHAKAAKVPIIVALTKIDLPGADTERIKQQLTEYELVAEEWGGETIMAPVSAITGQGIEHLLEMIILVADVQELKASPESQARGVIVEAKLDRWRGPVATVLIQNGTLHAGDYVVCGTVYGRVRAMNDDMGKRVDDAPPSMPVELLGLSETPEAGDILYAVADEKLARQVAEERKLKARAEQMVGPAPMKLDDLFSRMEQGEVIDLNIIIRADVRGSAEAVKSSLEKLTNDKVRVRTLQNGVGSINENDIMLAAASNAIVIGFNVRPDTKAQDAATREGVDVRTYRIIYNAIEDIEKAMKGLLKPEFKEVVHGHAEIRTVMKLSSVGIVAGSYVIDGKIVRGSQVRLLRDGVVVFEGKMAGLRRFKDDVKEVERGYECGITLDGYSDMKEGDVIESFVTEEIKVD